MFDEFLRVHLHACMEHHKEYPKLGQKLYAGGGRYNAENRRANQYTRHQFTQNKWKAETCEEVSEEPCRHKDEKQADHELRSYHTKKV